MSDSKNSKKRVFKWTRELVRFAINDGKTQQEIAKLCRTQQSIVSAWYTGSKQGTEQQLKPLLDEYGHRLRRNTFKVYWFLDTETMQRTIYRVEGKVILSQAFYDLRRDYRGKLIKKIPEFKLVIHHQGGQNFVIIHQCRLKFKATNEELEHSVEDAIWSSYHILNCMDVNTLLKHVDDYANQQLAKYPSDANTLPFLIRRALLNHGIPIDDIKEYPLVDNLKPPIGT
ncbi:hypothetical protein [Thiofilum flexile]|uniref:hypothetical protein n=1 Tax=Thiofilum flexile TaxID=125627 RepID=UPI0003A9F102|nr:hypothetical protein [Thiofilum flexile]